MELPNIFQKHLRSHIDFATFIFLDMVVVDDKKSYVFLVPRAKDKKDYCSIQLNDESKFFGSFDKMMEYALYFKLIDKKYALMLTKRYNKIMEELKNV